jgi:hypothetical protein
MPKRARSDRRRQLGGNTVRGETAEWLPDTIQLV